MQESLFASPESGRFEFQRWPLYRKAVVFCSNANQLCSQLPREGMKAIGDQLRRASHSIPLNIAEGSSRYSRNDKAHFLRISRGSVFECVAILDLLHAMGCAEEDRIDGLQSDLSELGRMLSGFIKHVEANNPNMTGSSARRVKD